MRREGARRHDVEDVLADLGFREEVGEATAFGEPGVSFAALDDEQRLALLAELLEDPASLGKFAASPRICTAVSLASARSA